MVRNYNEELEYFIFCSDADLNGEKLENISTQEWVPFDGQTKVWYARPEKLRKSLEKQLKTIRPDIILIIGLYSWHFNIVPLLFCKAPKKILSPRGMLHPGALSQKKWKKILFLKLFKFLKIHNKITFHATDSDEANYIRNHFGKPAIIKVAGNFPNDIGELEVAKKMPGNLNLLSIALLSPMKNILMVLESLQAIEAAVQYDIYGPMKDRTYWEQCEARIKLLPANIKASINKEIEPAKIAGVMLHAHVFILPSKSENFGHAIYEALSAGRPVITSYYTPWNNLQESFAGINVSTKENTELIKAINFFASMDQTTLQQWSNGAIIYVRKAIEVDKIRLQYLEMFGQPRSLSEQLKCATQQK